MLRSDSGEERTAGALVRWVQGRGGSLWEVSDVGYPWWWPRREVVTLGACVHLVAHRATSPSKRAVNTLKLRARSGLPGKRCAALHGLSQSARYARRKGLQAPVAAPIPNTRLVTTAVQPQPSFALLWALEAP